ncbi:UppS Undecaprenyl pyrophosphate synthase [Candidatus Nanopelagicaceae bacterium]
MLRSIRNQIKSLLYPFYEWRIVKDLDFSRTPRHIGVTLDGNRRWAKQNPDPTDPYGHKRGAQKIADLLGWCEETQVEVVTLWMLSTDNFKRSAEEVETLIQVISEIVDDLAARERWNIKAVGALDVLPQPLAEKLSNLPGCADSHLQVNVAIGYGGRREIVDAVKGFLLEEAKEGRSLTEAAAELDGDAIARHLYTAGQPDPDLLIRTSGEQRLGGFLLWQSALSEFYFCEAYWPDFRRVDFLRALRDYSLRHRRLGK